MIQILKNKVIEYLTNGTYAENGGLGLNAFNWSGNTIYPLIIPSSMLSGGIHPWIYHSTVDIPLNYTYDNINCVSTYDILQCWERFPTITEILEQQEFFRRTKKIDEENQEIDDYIECSDLECINEKNENVLTQFEKYNNFME